MIVKHETVMEWAEKDNEYVYFDSEDGTESYSMTHEQHYDLGGPDTITVAVWAGDRLQDERAVREQVVPL